MTVSKERLGGTILLAGAAAISVWSFVLLPRDFRASPVTPFDRSDPALAAAFRFLSGVRGAIPEGASVTVIAEPRDAQRETSLYASAVAVLQGRRVLPAAQWGAFTPGHELEADYVLVFGGDGRTAAPPGPLVAAVPGGAVYRRSRP